MSNTRFKLAEASYFLERMKAAQLHPDHFKYEMSAFWAASRSVTLIMQTEYSRTNGFKDWYAARQSAMAQVPDLAFFNEQRRMTIHEHFVHPEFTAIIDGGETEVRLDDVTGTISLHNVLYGQETHGVGEITVRAKSELTWYFTATWKGYRPSDDVLTVCSEYLRLLEGLVGECESQFGVPRQEGIAAKKVTIKYKITRI
jgi:hypothetical protein